ncbi:MAG TPA: ribonuclease G [Gammaproteobacteria bacterium]|jgi:ribonuclease G|nr:ribonuclease G [Acidiferrobacteraceae bacterium]MDP6551896.1 ribonuclease G [Arenicellales bacterium]MDP6791379.1 ribonuclease G [Arenicellales bacterium]MDP6919300.1 ribonuclease G [Arenicellales bacterium]HCX86416.1 ribonuclease G [Gammaproteobacteria bacterium]|tara:strand:- start:15763 stop:17274 length:1512 start_codon:yes stop_codon:yes gene_type:complete
MSEELLVNVTPQETRVAVVENGGLQELHIERSRSRGIVANIYKGKVVRVLPGMQAAFVDMGLERTAFLHAADMVPHRAPAPDPSGDADVSEAAVQSTAPPRPDISELVSEGQEVVVQVAKDPIGSKGARLTTQLSIPSRYLVLLPGSDHRGISQRIQDVDERDRLLQALNAALEEQPTQAGFIVRTAADSQHSLNFEADIEFVHRSWQQIERKIASARAGELIHADLALSLRAIRDLARDDVEKIRVDSRETYALMRQFAVDLMPQMADRIEIYPGERPIFDLYSVEDEIQRALDRTVDLKSGGSLVFDQTEAMTTVDVNTGRFVGKRNLEETLFKTNMEAAQAIARQLRLRNIGGIIIVDFIDMEDEEHRRQLMNAFERSLARDRTRCHIADMSVLGLVEVTRKRTRESLERGMTETCPHCQGRGTQKTAETLCYEIFREIMREARAFEAKGYLVMASQTVIDMLLDEESTGLADLQEFIGKPIHLQVEATQNQESYDVVLM